MDEAALEEEIAPDPPRWRFGMAVVATACLAGFAALGVPALQADDGASGGDVFCTLAAGINPDGTIGPDPGVTCSDETPLTNEFGEDFPDDPSDCLEYGQPEEYVGLDDLTGICFEEPVPLDQQEG